MIDFNKRKYIMFDLDGTVIDSKPGVYGALIHTMNKLGLTIPDEKVMQQFMGPAIGASFKRLLGLTEEQSNHAVDIYREYYGTRGIFECSVYDGIPELLEKLHSQGKKVALATKKPWDYTKRIVEHYGLDFEVVEGSNLEEKGEFKNDVLEKVITKFGSPDLGDVVLVGDTRYDCISANMVGVDCICELYGYGKKQDMVDNGAALIVADMAELTQTLCGR